MNLQTVIDFEAATLRRHNNRESEEQARQGCIRYMGQTEWVLGELLSGRKISSRIARDEFGIEDVRARIHSIRKMGINVLHEAIPGTNGSRQWFLSGDEIERVKSSV